MDAGSDHRRARLILWGVRCQKLGLKMAILGLLGALVGVLVQEQAGVSEVEQTASVLGSFLNWLFPVISILGLLVVFPASSIFYRRAGLVRRSGSVSDQVHADPDEADAEGFEQQEILPRWIGWPIWAVVTVASLLLIYALLAYGLPAWFARG